MGSKSLVNKPVSVPEIKKEAADFDIKDYAENTVKEVLGWYGYDQGGGGGSGSDSSEDPETPRATCPKTESTKDSATATQSSIPAGFMCCSWCQKVGSSKQFSLKSPNGNKAFCSEQCFTQSRRANFKRNKTCDWCRHIRHTVNYVDFHDGEQQLQFCSDKCLNQYKMNIFCTETQAHLELHPHPQEASTSEETDVPEGTNLITPDLWMRDCRSQSPDTDKSRTPPRIPSPLVEIKTSPSRTRFHPQRRPSADMRKSKRSPKTVPEQRRSYSPPSPGSRSPPHPQNLRVPPTHMHPFLQERPMFFTPPVLSSLPEPRFAHRSQLRKLLHPQGLPPPLLPIRPIHPQPIFPMFPSSLLPPPTTLVPYPILLPIPIPIPIPIPLPGVKLSDITALFNSKKHKDPKKPSHTPKETSPQMCNGSPQTSKSSQNTSKGSPQIITQETKTKHDDQQQPKPANPHRKRKIVLADSERTPGSETVKNPKVVHS